MELWGLTVGTLTLQGKESGRRVRMVHRWEWGRKEKKLLPSDLIMS